GALPRMKTALRAKKQRGTTSYGTKRRFQGRAPIARARQSCAVLAGTHPVGVPVWVSAGARDNQCRVQCERRYSQERPAPQKRTPQDPPGSARPPGYLGPLAAPSAAAGGAKAPQARGAGQPVAAGARASVGAFHREGSRALPAVRRVRDWDGEALPVTSPARQNVILRIASLKILG